MADPFQPKFVDLVRNYSTTTGTGNFTLGPAVNGHTSFTSALQVGDNFYYSAIGVDKPAEREVGRGTLLAGGVISRNPVSGTKTNFTSGTKSIALVAAAEWFNAIQAGGSGGGGGPASVSLAASRAALSAAPTDRPALLTLKGCEGLFTFDPADHSGDVSADGAQAIYVAPTSDTSGASGAWVRRHEAAVGARWSGVTGDGTTDDTAAIDSLLPLGSTTLFPAGTYVLSSTTIPASKQVQTAGFATRIKQLPGSIAGTRMVHLSGGSRVDDMAFEGRLGQTGDTTGEWNHGFNVAGSPANGGISLTSFGNTSGTNIRGDVAYVGGDYLGTIGTATISIASPAVVTRAAHGLADGSEVLFTTTGSLPTGLAAYTNYYVRAATANTFELSAYRGGPAINASGAQSGVHTLHAHRFGTSQVSFGHIKGDNVYRHGFCIIGGTTGVSAESVICGTSGVTAVDIEPEHYEGDVKGVSIKLVQGRNVHVVAGGVRATGIDFGMLDLHPTNYGTGSTPAYPYTVDSGVLFRNADVRIGKLLASDFNASAITANSGGTISSFVTIDNAEVINCNKLNTAGIGYIMGGGQSALTYVYRLGFLRARTDNPAHYVLASAAGSTVDFAEAALVTNSALVHGDDTLIQTLNVTKADSGNGGRVAYSSVRVRVLGGKADCDRFFASCTRSVAIGVDVTATTGVDVSGTNNSFWASRLNGSFYFLYANNGAISINDTGLALFNEVRSTTGYRVGSTWVLNSAGILQAAAFPALTGDVTTVQGALGTTIANNAVTYAKMQDVSAASKLLGRGDSGAGDPQEITLGAGLTMIGTTLSAAGGGGGPGGADRQIQFNNAGVLGGTTNLLIDASNNLTLGHAAATNAPGADKLTVVPQRIAAGGGRVMPRLQHSDASYQSLQSDIGRHSIFAFIPSSGSATITTIGAVALTALGTATATNCAATNRLTRAKRVRGVSAATAGSVGGWYMNSSGHRQWSTGGVPGGGFKAVFRFGVEDAAAVAGAHMFLGLRDGVGAPGGTLDPGTITNCIGVGQQNGSANLKLFYGGSAAQAPIDLGAGFPAADTSALYEATFYARADDSTKVDYLVQNLSTGAEAGGTLTGTAGTAIPSNSTLLAVSAFRNNNATAAAVSLGVAGIYIESEFA